MEVELAYDAGELFLARPVKADPRDAVVVFARVPHAGQLTRLCYPSAIAVDRSIGDHAAFERGCRAHGSRP